MRKIAIALFLVCLSQTAWALPPSSTLAGSKGTLAWTVTETADGVTLEGRSPKWQVKHKATKTLQPISTEHRSSDGTKTRVEYRADSATVYLPGETLQIAEAGLWDADTVDIRLGQAVADGKPKIEFRAIDPASGKVYGFDTQVIGRDKCGAVACTHLKLSMTGALRLVGPKWHYWFAADGALLRFEGPIGRYAVRTDG